MSKTFVLQDFLRHAGYKSLNEYCKEFSIPFHFDPSLIKQKSENYDEVTEYVSSFAQTFVSLEPQKQETIQADFQEVLELAGGKGAQMLINEAASQGVELPEIELDQMSEYEKAFWFYLQQPSIFNMASLLYVYDDLAGWKERNVGIFDTNELAKKSKELEQGLKDYLIQELRGRNCLVESYVRNGRVLCVAYPEDYAEVDVSYDKSTLNKRNVRKPVQKIYFDYNSENGRLGVKTKGGWTKANLYLDVFCTSVLEINPKGLSDYVYDLNILKNKSFSFDIDPEDKIDFVKVKLLRLYFLNGKDRLMIESVSDLEKGMDGVFRVIEEFQVPLDQVNITQAVIKIKFKEKLYKRSRATITVRLTHPNSQNLSTGVQDNIVKKYLRLWQIDIPKIDVQVLTKSDTTKAA